MQVNISTRHGHLQGEDQQIIAAKVEKLRRFFDRINAIEVTVDLEKLDRPNQDFALAVLPVLARGAAMNLSAPDPQEAAHLSARARLAPAATPAAPSDTSELSFPSLEFMRTAA